MTQACKTNILLESGTNELEIVEFSLGGNCYGINVAKVREIIRYPDSVIPVPNSHNSIDGIVDLRGHVVPIIDLARHLGDAGVEDKSSSYVIISEFNMSMVGFCVSAVERIHRLSWKQIEPPAGMVSSGAGSVVAIIKFDDRMVLLLDFEKITSDIDPSSGMQKDSQEITPKQSENFDRSAHTVFVVEDSRYIQKIIVNAMQKAGYQVLSADNGQIAWDKIKAIIADPAFSRIEDYVSAIISDIEMPQMDGLHLIKNIKTNHKLNSVPCIVFSSLISQEMASKCKSVGADAQISKPELASLVGLVDGFLTGAASPV